MLGRQTSQEFKIKLLVVEDDDSQCALINKTLLNQGYLVESVMSGIEALDKYRAYPEYLIVLDYNLPDITGLEVIETLKKEFGKIEFITMTAYGNEHVAVEMMKNGARDYIVKDTNLFSFLPSVVANTVSRIKTEKELKESKDALKEARERYYDLFENSKDAVYFTSSDGKILGFNNSMMEMFGYSPEELREIKSEQLYLDPIDRLFFVNEMECSGFVKNYEVKLITKHDQIRECLITASVKSDKLGNLAGYSGIIHDVTARKEAERKLADSEERYRSLFERVPLGIYRSTPDGTNLDANPGLLKMLGLEEKDKMSLNVGEYYLDQEDRKKWQEIMDKTGKVIDYEFQLQTADNAILWVNDSARAYRRSDGKVLYYEGVVTDINDRKQAEEEKEIFIRNLTESKEQIESLAKEIMELNDELMATAEQLKVLNASKDKFFSIIAHDLKSPFTGFMGLTEMLSSDLEALDKDDIKAMAESMNEAAKNIYELLINLLDWSRLQGGIIHVTPEIISLQDVVHKTMKIVESQAAKKNIKITCDVAQNIIVKFDLNMLLTICRNLVSNAVKFSHDNSIVEINALEASGGKIYLQIKDYGIGIPKENLKYMFKIEKHYSTRGTKNEKGTGLGLILCKELAELAGQDLYVETELGNGSIFSLTLDRYLENDM